MKEKARSFIVTRFREHVKTRKIIKVVKLKEGVTEVQFEGKVTLRLNHTEAEVLKKELIEEPVDLNAHALSENNKGKK